MAGAPVWASMASVMRLIPIIDCKLRSLGFSMEWTHLIPEEDVSLFLVDVLPLFQWQRYALRKAFLI